MATSEVQRLRAEVERLQAENAELGQLRAENDALRDAAVPPPVVPPEATRVERRPGRWRAWVSALIIVIAAILVPVSIVSAWARVQLVDEDAFVATLAPLAEDPAVQSMLIDETMDAVNAKVDFAEITSNVFDGIADLGLGPVAKNALELLKQPAADGLQNLVQTGVTRVVESDAFADVWATATRAAHRALTTAATSDGGGLVVMTDDGVGIQLGAIVDQVKQKLVDRGVGVAQMIPAVDKVVIIGTGTALVTIRTAYAIATTLGWWLPVITLALFAVGILVARRRSVAIAGTGVGFAIGGGALALGFAVGSVAVGTFGADLGLSVPALDVIYSALVDSMRQTAAVIAVLGVFIAVLGWFLGRSSGAVRSRAAIRGLNASARLGLARRGFDTGAFGTWLARYRVLVRVLITVLAVLWLYALRPLSFGDLVLVIVVAFAVAWILELLQRRSDEHETIVVVDAVDDDPVGTLGTDASAQAAGLEPVAEPAAATAASDSPVDPRS